jgi:hypothetical protein
LRQAALSDRQAAAEDRRLAAGDRDRHAAYRDQAALQRAQQAGYRASAGWDGGAELVAAARAARARAGALCRHVQTIELPPPSGELLRKSLVARQAARLRTMPVIEQAKGIIMAQRRCGEDEAFDVLRRASQRMNRPVRDLAAQLVANSSAAEEPAPVRAKPAGS